MRLRGAEANHLLVMVDGVGINDPALGSSVDFANLDLIGATRIEILPGAQSALWGSNALAGVLSFETTPAPGADVRNVWLEGGSNDTARESIQLAHAAAMPGTTASTRAIVKPLERTSQRKAAKTTHTATRRCT